MFDENNSYAYNNVKEIKNMMHVALDLIVSISPVDYYSVYEEIKQVEQRLVQMMCLSCANQADSGSINSPNLHPSVPLLTKLLEFNSASNTKQETTGLQPDNFSGVPHNPPNLHQTSQSSDVSNDALFAEGVHPFSTEMPPVGHKEENQHVDWNIHADNTTDDYNTRIGTTNTSIMGNQKLRVPPIKLKASLVSQVDRKSPATPSDAQMPTHPVSTDKDRPYCCGVCFKTFARPSHFREHCRIHSGVRPYTCDLCFKTFSRTSHLNRHKLVHSDDVPFKCPMCPAGYKRKNLLNNHLPSHNIDPTEYWSKQPRVSRMTSLPTETTPTISQQTSVNNTDSVFPEARYSLVSNSQTSLLSDKAEPQISNFTSCNTTNDGYNEEVSHSETANSSFEIKLERDGNFGSVQLAPSEDDIELKSGELLFDSIDFDMDS